MKALSLSRPWDYAVLRLGKDMENRTWATRYRGRILIHRAKSWDADGLLWMWHNRVRLGVTAEDRERMMKLRFEPGGLVGEVDITDCISRPDVRCASRWYFGPYGFLLANPAYYERVIPYRGMPGLFEVPMCSGCAKPLTQAPRPSGCPGELCDRCAQG